MEVGVVGELFEEELGDMGAGDLCLCFCIGAGEAVSVGGGG